MHEGLGDQKYAGKFEGLEKTVRFEGAENCGEEGG